MQNNYVAYYRVSTKKQGQSGLGLASQKRIVQDYVKDTTLIIAEYTEVESGKKCERMELNKAIAHCKEKDAILIIAKLDRLSRDVAFIFQLRDSGIQFQACDIPEANTLTIGLFATIAQYERELISTRTKQALVEKKKQGFKLGNPTRKIHQWQRNLAIKKRRQQSKQKNKQALEIAKDLRSQGLSYEAIAKHLNKYEIKPPKSKNFNSSTIWNLLNRPYFNSNE